MAEHLKRAWALIPRDPKDPDVYRVARVLVRGMARARDCDLATNNYPAYQCVVEGSEGTRRIVGGNLYRTKAEAVKACRSVNQCAMNDLHRNHEMYERFFKEAKARYEKADTRLREATEFLKEHKP